MGAWAPLLVALAGTLVREVLVARPPNITYSVNEESCNLMVSWPVEPPSSNCTQQYKVGTRIGGNWDDSTFSHLEETSWTEFIPLGEKIDFGVKTFCNSNDMETADWEDDETFHVVQNGIAGTGARNLGCIWWNKKYMECSWLSGEKASPDTSYKLSYSVPWKGVPVKAHQCKNVTHKGSVFRCRFKLDFQHIERISISVQGSSGNIQPTCFISKSTNDLVKVDRPSITNSSKYGTEMFLQWNKPVDFSFACCDSEVEVNGSSSEIKFYKHKYSATITVESDVQLSFRVRIRTEKGHWSDWSDAVVADVTTSMVPILLLILIPFFVALLLVILLIYLKRIKLLVFPKIPDPRNFLKDLFEEQSENQHTHEIVNNDETPSLLLVEPVGNEK